MYSLLADSSILKYSAQKFIKQTQLFICWIKYLLYLVLLQGME